MNKYRSVMKKITISPQTEEKILKNIEKENHQAVTIKKQDSHKWVKPFVTIATCCIIIMSVSIIAPFFIDNTLRKQQQDQSYTMTSNVEGTYTQTSEMPIQLGNPISNVEGIEALKKSVSFELLVPANLPTGYKIKGTSVVAGKLVQIIYTNGNDEINYRTAEGAQDISGDYTSYEASDVVKAGDVKVTLKGNKSLISLAVWTQDGCTYALSFSAGTEKEVVLSLIEHLRKA